ncbi:pentapeptide repeat-containing protein [Clostridium sp. WILCCON 0269]|uniref:Pentapeptide repeat-containing protein n=1 Tax=Candidatus Clostridium eludens TaxID=3381663 RepID=A0ABW8SS26_9CLOT
MKYDVKICEDKSILNEVVLLNAKGTIDGKRTIRYNSSTEIKFLNDDGSAITTKEYGYIIADEIIEKIKYGEEIILNECYVSDLVLDCMNIINLFLGEGAFFDCTTSFNKTSFFRYAYFDYATFSEEVDFGRGEFHSKAYFDEAKFLGEAYFDGAKFRREVCFYMAEFNKEADFSYAKFSGETDFSKVRFSRETSFAFATFSEKTLDLGGVEFNSLCLTNTKNLGQIFLDWKGNNIKEAIYNYAKEHKLYHHTVAKQFLMLKENFNRIGQYDDEDAAYVEYRRCEAKSEFSNENGRDKGFKRICKRIVYPFRWFVFDYIGSYATAPLRIFRTLCLSILSFGVIYFLGGIYSSKFEFGNGPIAKCLERFIVAIYFSAITSFTVGYGDISPQSCFIAVVAVIESFIGVFLMSYFTVAFARKILR